MTKKKNESLADKKTTLSLDDKARLIKEVRETLTPELQTLFDEYSSGRNPQLSKNLLNPKTDWKDVLTKWESNKKKKNKSKVKQTANIKTLLRRIDIWTNTNTYESLETAISFCHDLIKVLEQKQDKQVQAKLKENDAKIAQLQAESKKIKEKQAKKAGEQSPT